MTTNAPTVTGTTNEAIAAAIDAMQLDITAIKNAPVPSSGLENLNMTALEGTVVLLPAGDIFQVLMEGHKFCRYFVTDETAGFTDIGGVALEISQRQGKRSIRCRYDGNILAIYKEA